jgi:non-specific serine/threonine protein kinase
MPILLTPHGHLLAYEAEAGLLSEKAGRGLARAAAEGSAAVLIWLGTEALGEPLPAAGGFWRELARRYFSQLRMTPEVAGTIAAPEAATGMDVVLSAPPLPGGEYLTTEVLARLWAELDAAVAAAGAAFPGGGGVGAWLHAQNPLWNQVGRVTFHLAENKRDPAWPFAFLATYTHRMSEQAKPQYLPLGRALQEYAQEGQRAALVALLAPVERAAARSDFVRELVDTQKVFAPQRWTPREAHRFLREVAALEDSGVLVRLPDWWRAGNPARPAVAVTVGGRPAAGVGLGSMLDFQVGLTLDGETISPEEWAALAASADGLVLLKGKWVEVDREKLGQVLEHWRTLEKGRRDGGVSFAEGLRMLAGAEAGGGAPEAAGANLRTWTRVQPGEWLRATLAEMRSPGAGGAVEAPPPGLRATLRPYQAAGVAWLRFLSRLGLGACLADDMGLGKTIQVLGLMLHARAEQPGAAPVLLVLPASLLGNWSAEAAKFAPSLRLRVAHGSGVTAAELAALADASAPAKADEVLRDVDVVLTTYGQVARLDGLRAREWSLVVLDEAQAIKNPGSRQSRAVKELRAARRIALTGTPVENRLGDLWSLFDFINPGLLGKAAEFTRLAKKITQGDAPAAYAPLRQLVAPYILRRMKTDKRIIADLPDKTEVNALCGLSKRQAVLYEQTVRALAEKLEGKESDPMARRGLVLATLMRLKQLCNHPAQWAGESAGADYTPEESGKFLRLAELAGEIAERQEKVLVFTQFRELTGPLERFLAGVFGRAGLVLHGGTAVAERRRLVERFQEAEGPPFFVLSLKAGGTGLTLTEAGHVIHFDRWWNPAVENQATDRAYRIGQKKNVLVHKFVCRGTLEERIDKLITEKRALADAVLAEGGEAALTEMKDDELLKFVALDLRTALAEG